jgi:nicotinate-nucleotide pyrophosphorylase (carboxylating)
MSRMKVANREIPPPRNVLERIVAMALEEDLGRGDITTEACVPRSVRGEATFRSRAQLVLAGIDVVKEVYRQVDAEIEVHDRAKDGDAIERGQAVARVIGRAANLLAGERVALNFLQRLSGIATMTRAYVDAVPEGLATRITGTRKTTPGLRALERYAVRCGGGYDHREDLSSSVLIKDNHIAAAGGVAEAIRRARSHAPHTSRIECEVDSEDQIEEAITAGADIIMLDNFSDATLPAVRATIGKRAIVEVSGGVTLARIPVIAKAGIDIISVGALTHSAPAMDIGLDWESSV